MRAVIVYESMYGNTRAVAETVAAELGGSAVSVADASADDLAGADLLVVGAPTHAWNMSRPSTRRRRRTPTIDLELLLRCGAISSDFGPA